MLFASQGVGSDGGRPGGVVSRLVAIHQPNFFPWLGYFDKIRRADVFVVLDNVQHQKTGGTWSNRVMLNLNGATRWATAPTVRNYHGVRPVNAIEFDETAPWREKLAKTLEASYRRARHYDEAMALLRPLLLNPERRLWAYNMAAIHKLVETLSFERSEIVLASTLPGQGTATELLVSLVRAVGGDAYLSGGGADGYQEAPVFESAGVRLVYQSFKHPVYAQRGGGEFVPGLSIIDPLMNCGIAGTRQLLAEAA
jgi:hypothetical protein